MCVDVLTNTRFKVDVQTSKRMSGKTYNATTAAAAVVMGSTRTAVVMELKLLALRTAVPYGTIYTVRLLYCSPCAHTFFIFL